MTKGTQGGLRTSEIRYRRLFEAARDGILILNAVTLKITDVNPFMIEFLGYSRDEFLGKELWEIGFFGDKEASQAAFLDLQTKGYLRYEDLPLQTRRGKSRQVEFVSNVYEEDGDEVIQCNIRDIAERTQAAMDQASLNAQIESQRRRLNSIVANVPGIVWEASGEPHAATQRIDFVSKYVETMLGYSVEEWLSTPNFWLTIVHPDDRERAARDAAATFLNGESSIREFRWIAKDGRSVCVEAHSAVVFDEQGTPIGSRGVTIDITERKHAEEDLRESEERYRSVVETASDAIFIIDETSKILFVNSAAESIFGYSIDEMKGASLTMLMPAYLRHLHKAGIERYLLTGHKHLSWNYLELTGLHRSAREIPLELSFAEFTQGGRRYFTGIITDITKRKLAEETLHQSEERYRLLFEKNPQPMWVYDVETLGFLEVNDAALHHYGYSRDEFLSMTIMDIRHPDEIPGLLKAAEDESTDLHDARAWRHLKKDGTLNEMEVTSHALSFAGIPARLVLAKDITVRNRALESLSASEERYRDLVENALDIIYTHDLDGNFTSVNKAAEKITGYTSEEALKMNMVQAVAPEYREKAMQMMAAKLGDNEVQAYDLEILAKDGRRAAVEVNIRIIYENSVPVGIQGIARDITYRKQLEQQFRQSQKMEAIGQLAGGIAHDFNNLLTAITGYSELTLRRLPAEDPLRQNIEEVKKAGDRAAALTRQLLAFSRKQVLQPKVFDLNAVVSELENMLRRLINEDIELKTVLESELGSVKADPGQIEQIIVNLAVNARDAMPLGGKLTIETRNVYLDEDYAKNHVAVIPGPYVMLAVSDNGTGIDEETLARIFEPFFTTKETGKGTGLGLSTAYGIVKQSGGSIWVYSEVGKGTTFKVYLPRVDEPAKEYKRNTESEECLIGAETILLAEDEGIVRNLARDVLQMYGYQVLVASNGGAALLISERHKVPIHLLITDVVMPEMSGRELADRLAGLRPDMKVLYMSGYTDDAIVHQGVLDDEANFIEKPFTPDGLARKVRKVLSS